MIKNLEEFHALYIIKTRIEEQVYSAVLFHRKQLYLEMQCLSCERMVEVDHHV